MVRVFLISTHVFPLPRHNVLCPCPDPNSIEMETWCPAQLVALHPLPHLLAAIQRLTHTDPTAWSHGWGLTPGLPISHVLDPDFLGVATLAFYLVDLVLPLIKNPTPTAIATMVPSPGDAIIIHSSPFGLSSPVLANSVSQGVVGNVIRSGGKSGEEVKMMMMDVR